MGVHRGGAAVRATTLARPLAELAAGEVRSRDARAQNFKLALNGEGGTYDVRASFDVAEGGAAEGHFVFDAAGDTAEVNLELAANGLLLNVASGEVDDPSQIPPLGFLATVRSKGDSPRALASVANGRLILTQGAGRIDNSTVGLASGDILAQIFSALNPFAKDEHTRNGTARSSRSASRTESASSNRCSHKPRNY